MARRWLAAGLLLLFFALALSSARGDSPTMDEQNHIARGLAFLRTGDPRLSVEHPPLVNVLSALPLLTQPIVLPTDDWSWEVGEWYRFADLLLWQANQDVARMVFLARLPIMLLGTMLGALVYRVTASMFGRGRAPCLALVLYVLDPNILAHSRYATTDLGVTAFLFLAMAALWWADRSEYRPAPVILAGCAYGLALGSKLSAATFAPVMACMMFARLIQRQRTGEMGTAAAGLRLATLAPVSALLVLWATYGFQIGPVREGGAAVPMPLFWRGMATMLDFSSGGRPAFLLGHFSAEGFRAYFPVALGVKTPLPSLLLLAASIAWFAWKLLRRLGGRPVGSQGRCWSLLCLLLPALFYFLLSTQSSLNLGYRHLLPTLPLLYAFVGGQVAQFRWQESLGRSALALLLAWLALGNLLIFPHYLSYFNELVGPKSGYQVLVDSNVDWGQDLLRLRSWMEEQKVERVKLAWFGSAYPAYYGIDYDPLPGLPHHFDLWEALPFDPEQPEPGIYVISASMLQELHRRDEDKTAFGYFRVREPDDRVGYSLLIYRVGVP